MRAIFIATAALALSGCATTYQLSLMPRDSGKLYSGIAEDTSGGEGRITIEIEGKRYQGTWLQTVAHEARRAEIGPRAVERHVVVDRSHYCFPVVRRPVLFAGAADHCVDVREIHAVLAS